MQLDASKNPDPDLRVRRSVAGLCPSLGISPGRLWVALEYWAVPMTRGDQIAFRDVLIVAVLTTCPIRMRNLEQIEIGRH